MAHSFNQLPKDLQRALEQSKEVIKKLPGRAGQFAVNHAQDNFNRQQFGSDGAQWKQSKRNKGKTLFDKGELMNSVGFKRSGNMQVLIQSDAPHAKIHNEGGTIKVTKKMRQFFWYKYKATGEEHWKYMAMTKGDKLKFPKRQFMGIHKDIDNEIETWIDDQFDAIFI